MFPLNVSLGSDWPDEGSGFIKVIYVLKRLVLLKISRALLK